MSSDPYKTLGVSHDASQEDIRKAYRKLAKELHPDLRPGDRKAEDRFKEVSAAYHLVGDPERRARFDRGEIDASGAERPEHQFYRHHAESDGGGRYHSSAGFQDFEDVSDLFADLLGRRGGAERTFRARGPDIQYHLEIEFLEAASGAKKRITMPGGQYLDLTIPAGTRDGSMLRLKDKGGPGLGDGQPGDALIQITVKPHRIFRREGDDIVIDLPLTLDEAVLGGKVEVPTISGRVNLTVPENANTGDVLRLRGKGIKPAAGKAGDQRVVLQVTLPEEADSELKEFITKWRRTHRYDPRGDLRRS